MPTVCILVPDKWDGSTMTAVADIPSVQCGYNQIIINKRRLNGRLFLYSLNVLDKLVEVVPGVVVLVGLKVVVEGLPPPRHQPEGASLPQSGHARALANETDEIQILFDFSAARTILVSGVARQTCTHVGKKKNAKMEGFRVKKWKKAIKI